MSRFLGTLVMLLCIAGCDTEKTVSQPPSPATLEKTDRTKFLIGMLASKNQAPPITGALDDQRLRFPSTYDFAAQAPVFLAIQQLLREGEIRIDELLAHKDDDRYSFTVWTVGPTNVTVSQACFWIARMQVLCFEGETHYFSADQKSLYPEFLNSTRFAEWWAKNKQRGLATLQLEAVDTMLKFTRTADWKKARRRYLSENPDLEEDFNQMRDENIPVLESIRAAIVSGKRAYQPSALKEINWGASFIGMPWTKFRWG